MHFFFGWTGIVGGWSQDPASMKVVPVSKRPSFFDASWGEMGIPSIITSDLGSHFISEWWKAMCNRLGIRQAYSQAYRAQANGHAEVAGRVIKDLLRKLHAEMA